MPRPSTIGLPDCKFSDLQLFHLSLRTKKEGTKIILIFVPSFLRKTTISQKRFIYLSR